MTSRFFLLLFIITALPGPVTGVRAQTSHGESDAASYNNPAPDVFMTRWFVLGPVPLYEKAPDEVDMKAEKKAFHRRLLDSYHITDPDEGDKMQIEGADYRWQYLQSDEPTIDFVKHFGENDFAVAFAWAEIVVTDEKSVLLGVGSDDGVKIWINGKNVHDKWAGRPVSHDDDLVPVTFSKGKNVIVLKIQNTKHGWGFSCRVIGSGSFPKKLRSSAERGDMDAISFLLENGADPNATTGPGLTALHQAKISGRKDVVDLLVKNGADQSIPMPTPESMLDTMITRLVGEDDHAAVVLVAKDGNVLYEKAFGKADFSYSVPAGVDTKFRIGSITKQFTAAAILKLQEQGSLSVTDKLSEYLPDFPRADEVTLHHLLTHSSGIHSYTDNPEFFKRATVGVEPEDQIELIKEDPYDFDPGKKWHYNNSGYYILGYIVTKVSGKSYGEYLEETFFDPIGMNSTGVHTATEILEHEAQGYSWNEGKFEKAMNWDMSQAGGAGCLYSTISDLYKWNQALFNGNVLGKQSLTAAFTPVEVEDGNEMTMLGGKYGYGWVISETRGLKEISHGGGLHGFVTHASHYPDVDATVIAFSNCVPARRFAPAAVARSIAQMYLWKDMESQKSFVADTTVSEELLEKYTGRYEYPRGSVMKVTRDGYRMYAQITGQPRFEIFSSSDDEFFWKVADAQVRFVMENGLVKHAVHTQGGAEFEAPRMADETPVEVDPSIFREFVGEFEIAEGQVIVVTTKNDKLFAGMKGQPISELYPRSEYVYYPTDVVATITFLKNEDGLVDKLELIQGGRTMMVKRIK